MKNNIIPYQITRQHDPELEKIVSDRHDELMTLARKNARHYASKNLPSPEETIIDPYVGDLRNGYYHLSSQIAKHLQPGSHFPAARMELVHLQDKDKKLTDEIRKKQNQNQSDKYEIENFDPKSLQSRRNFAIWFVVIIAITEIAYNTKAFQILGENMLFALVISIGISASVFLFSHLIPTWIKGAKTKLMRCLIAIGSLLAVTGLFIALAMFRSQYLEAHGEHVSPWYFVMINLFLFVVATLLSYKVLPTWKEFKDNSHRIRIFKDIEKRKAEIEKLNKDREDLKAELLERAKSRMQLANYAHYSTGEIRSMYRSCLGVFQSTNLLHRSDKRVPKCFTDEAKDVEIDRFEITYPEANNLES
jgi:hypothetical protein